MKNLLLTITIILLLPVSIYAGNWGSMIWGQDNWGGSATDTTTTTITITSSDCYIDISCDTDGKYVRSCSTGECAVVQECYNLWACSGACNGSSCGGGTVKCTISPGCSDDVQRCDTGICTDIANCTDRIHEPTLLNPYPCDESSATTTTTVPSGNTTTIPTVTTTIGDCTYGSCITTAECTDALGSGWVCQNGCCEQVPVTTTIGGEDCPISSALEGDEAQLDAIRVFRDNVLAQTPEGQEIIRLYYQWSPIIVQAMENDAEFKEWVAEQINGILPLVEEAVE